MHFRAVQCSHKKDNAFLLWVLQLYVLECLQELLALEERIGNVSTGLTPDEVVEKLTKSYYSSLDAVTASYSEEYDIKCSICQVIMSSFRNMALIYLLYLVCDMRYFYFVHVYEGMGYLLT